MIDSTQLENEASIRDLDANLTLAVAHLYRRLRKEKTVGELGDSLRSVLVLLVREGPRTLGELSEIERVTPPSMNQSVNSLVHFGYVERQDDPTDGRKVILVATPTGKALVEESRRRVHDWLQVQLRQLSAEERLTLQAAALIVEKLADA